MLASREKVLLSQLLLQHNTNKLKLVLPLGDLLKEASFKPLDFSTNVTDSPEHRLALQSCGILRDIEH
ncbi:MAG: hypothetical protein L6Q47_16705, partial [Ignavibacteriaceae bacterium]|nr:hypothetical protein [Ignavibacteriaceae bacterium]